MPLVLFFASLSMRKCRPVQTKMQDHCLLNPDVPKEFWLSCNE